MVRLMNGFVLEEDGSICGLGGIGGTAGGRVSDEKSWDVRLEPVGVAWVEVARVRGGESLGEAVSVGWACTKTRLLSNGFPCLRCETSLNAAKNWPPLSMSVTPRFGLNSLRTESTFAGVRSV